MHISITSHTNEEGMDGSRAYRAITDNWRGNHSAHSCSEQQDHQPCHGSCLCHTVQSSKSQSRVPCLGCLALLQINSAVYSLVTNFASCIWGKDQPPHAAVSGNLHLSQATSKGFLCSEIPEDSTTLGFSSQD